MSHTAQWSYDVLKIGSTDYVAFYTQNMGSYSQKALWDMEYWIHESHLRGDMEKEDGMVGQWCL